MVTKTAPLGASNQKRFGWVLLLYPPFLLLLRLLYNRANQIYGVIDVAKAPSTAWWLLIFVYFILDVLLILGLRFLHRSLTIGDTPTELFRREIWEIVPLWFLFHLMQLLFDPGVAWRLESVGLGGLEWIVFAAFMISVAGNLWRKFRASSTRP